MKKLNIDRLDFVYVVGDAYVDHPSFGHAIISRVLQSAGYTVGIIAQPDWHSCEAFKTLGEPRLGFLVAAGNIDSMVNHYTAAKKVRNTDFYSPGGEAGLRPDRATIVYCNRIREAFGRSKPIIIGGIEASLRRFSHYDYWSDSVRRSILIDSGADLLIFGMGEKQIVKIADLLAAGARVCDIKSVRGTAYLEGGKSDLPADGIMLPSYDETRGDKRKYAEATRIEYEEQDAVRGRPLIQLDCTKYVVQNPPEFPLEGAELDAVYALPYMRRAHPMYDEFGGVPAIGEVEFSLTSCRGCFGGCNFCALTLHQGRAVSARSHESLIAEAQKLIASPNFKGYIHDVGGPTANFRAPSCEKQKTSGVCKQKQCLFPSPCSNLDVSHKDYLELLRKLRKLKDVKKVFVRSGIRYDYLLADKDETFFRELCMHHISGQLKIAPEHISDGVLKYMGKPPFKVYNDFCKRFDRINKNLGKKQYTVPYLMSSHPGSTLKDAVHLAEYLRDCGHEPEQVQDFYPTPGSISTCMYYTGLDPRTMKQVYVPKSYKEKQMQRALLQYRNPKNYSLVYEALKKAGREDLIGYGAHCLIKPKNNKGDVKHGKAIERQGSVRKSKGGVKARGGQAKGKGSRSGSGGGNRRRRPRV